MSLFIYFRLVDLYHKPDRISNGCWLFLRPCGIKISPFFFFLDLVSKGIYQQMLCSIIKLSDSVQLVKYVEQ